MKFKQSLDTLLEGSMLPFIKGSYFGQFLVQESSEVCQVWGLVLVYSQALGGLIPLLQDLIIDVEGRPLDDVIAVK
ncbi:MAG: hypothetical protein L6R35_007580, partial [Caloplaca aegaea]